MGSRYERHNQVSPNAHTILIVEDNSINLKVIQHVLKKAGYNYLLAENGEEGLAQAVRFLPDLILLDIMMPGIDGFEVCATLQSNSRTSEIPIIFMTTLSDTNSVVKAFNLGAVDYVTKPFQAAEVLARIKTHLKLRQLQKGLLCEIQERELLIADLDAFSHTVAHDLKNPIGHVVGVSEILARYNDRLKEEKKQEMLNDLVQSAFKMRDIIDSLLLLARVRLEKVNAKPIKMENVLGEVVQRLKPMISQYDAQIQLPEKWPQVQGYEPWVEEIWVNYLTNGLKYGGSPPMLELGATAVSTNNQIKFWVKDNGIGLTQDQQTRLYEPFVRFGHKKANGHGLGLSVVQRIVEKLGGQVGVESQLGQGSTFYFTLPGAN